jgi:hypothetical protein
MLVKQRKYWDTMVKISVITPTIRPKGLSLVKKALSRQSMTDFEWLIGSPFNALKYGQWVEDDFKGGKWTLNRIYNRLISRANGELLVSWQDYTFADPDALEKFWFHYQNEPKTLVSGIGGKYTDPNFLVSVWEDPRKNDKHGSYYPCYWTDIEWNFCSCPKQAIYDIGGFDEGADFEYLGMDGYGVNERLNDLGGYDFKLDQTNQSYSLVHSRVGNWDKDNGLNGPYNRRKEELKKNHQWLKMNYLK